MILGIDPGIKTMGYGIIQPKGDVMQPIVYGTVDTSAKLPFVERLKILYDGISGVIEKYQPKEMAIEEVFYHKNVRVVMVLGHARASAILAAVNLGLPVSEYSPLEVKKAVVGKGSASKEQVQFMVKAILNLEKEPKPNDAADALAVAICHHNRSKFLGNL